MAPRPPWATPATTPRVRNCHLLKLQGLLSPTPSHTPHPALFREGRNCKIVCNLKKKETALLGHQRQVSVSVFSEHVLVGLVCPVRPSPQPQRERVCHPRVAWRPSHPICSAACPSGAAPSPSHLCYLGVRHIWALQAAGGQAAARQLRSPLPTPTGAPHSCPRPLPVGGGQTHLPAPSTGWYVYQFHRILQYARPLPGSPQPFFWMFVDNLVLTEEDLDVATRFLEVRAGRGLCRGH